MDRRSFFRTMGRQAIRAAGNAVGTADALKRDGTAAVNELIGLGVARPAETAARLERGLRSDAGAAARTTETETMAGVGRTDDDRGSANGLEIDGVTFERGRDAPLASSEVAGDYRSPYRIEDDRLRLLDQRTVPGQRLEVACGDAASVAAAMRSGTMRGGPVLAQLTAYGLALTAMALRDADARRREAGLRSAMVLLRHARPAARSVAWAIERAAARLGELGPDALGQEVATALRDEADRIAFDATLDHARLGRIGAAAIPQPTTGPIEIALHGELGALAGGMVGPGLALIQALGATGRLVRCWVPEGRPGFEGARLLAWELAQADLAYTVIADAALGWLFAERSMHALVLGAERVTANGDVVARIGGRAAAQLAAAAGIPVFVVAPLAVFDATCPTGREAPAEFRPTSEGTKLWHQPIGLPLSAFANPSTDLVPSHLVRAILTEEGVATAPFGQSLADAWSKREARRSPAILTEG